MEIGLKVLKKIIDIITTIILIVGFALVLLYICGIKPYVILSGSMEPKISTGSVCFVNEKAKYEDMTVGDIIAFKIPTGASVTHRIINITDKGFETKGDANEESDGISTTKQNFLGKNLFSIKNLGFTVEFIQSTRGRIVLITMIVFFLASGFLLGEPKKEEEISILEEFLEEGEDLVNKKEKNNIKEENVKEVEEDSNKEKPKEEKKIKFSNDKKIKARSYRGKRFKH